MVLLLGYYLHLFHSISSLSIRCVQYELLLFIIVFLLVPFLSLISPSPCHCLYFTSGVAFTTTVCLYVKHLFLSSTFNIQMRSHNLEPLRMGFMS